MVKAIAIAAAVIGSLVFWILKRYFTRGDEIKRLKAQRTELRNEAREELEKQFKRPLNERNLDRYCDLVERVRQVNKKIEQSNVRK